MHWLLEILRLRLALVSIAALVAGVFSIWASLPDATKLRYIGTIEEAIELQLNPPDERFNVSEASKLDVVFLVDITVSMQPFLSSLVGHLDELSGSSYGQEWSIRYSVITFADDPVPSTVEVPLLAPGEFPTMVLNELSEVPLLGRDFGERSFDAITNAISLSDWAQDSNRLIILITDAPSREHSKGLSEEEIISALAESRVVLSTVYLGWVLRSENPYERLCNGINYSLRGDCLSTEKLDYLVALDTVLEAFMGKVEAGKS